MELTDCGNSKKFQDLKLFRIAKWITEQHQGRIGIENDDNGAVIHIQLPLTVNMT